jgi:short-subunit dehydrogenase
MKKISVISGGGSGLGLETAGLLSARGHNVLILGRDAAKLGNAVRRLQNQTKNNNVCSLSCNIGNEKDVFNVCKFLDDNDYRVEYLFNNAGLGMFALAHESTSERIDKVF